MSSSQWHKYYRSEIAAPPEVLFELLSDLPNYSKWLPDSDQFKRTTVGSAAKTGAMPEPSQR
jgi:hypothetical protein